MQSEASLEQLLAPCVESLGCDWVGCQWSAASKGVQTLRIYVDEPEGGVSVDKLSKISRQVSALLDVESSLAGKYFLEVSSPGLDRLLFKPSHYQQQKGQKLHVHLRSTKDGRKNFKGVLLEVSQEKIQLKLESHVEVISFSDIEKARVIPDIIIGTRS